MATRRLLTERTGAKLDLLADKATPFYIAHRGGANVFPENTLEAFRAVVDLGVDALEIDCWRLHDGAIGVMHDSTVDRTTTATGAPATFTSQQWQALTVDAGSWFLAGGQYGNLKAPLLSEVISEFGGKVLLIPEIKNTALAQPLADMVSRFRLQEAVLPYSFTNSHMTPFQAIGCKTGIVDEAGAVSAATHLANGHTWVLVDRAQVSSAAIEAFIAAGLKVGVYNIARHVHRDVYTPLGVHAFISDDPIYLKASASSARHRATTDPFASKTFWHGHAAGTGSDKGEWIGTNRGGFTANTKRFVQQGWACPLENTSYTLSLSLTYDTLPSDTTRWAGIAFSIEDDDRYDDVTLRRNGYLLLVRANGTIEVFRQTSAGGTTNIGSVSSAVIGQGATVTLTVQVTATQIIVTRTDVDPDVVLTLNDSTYRGRYLHFGVDGSGATGLDISFSGVTIT